MTADRSVLVRLRADISDFQRKFATASATTAGFVKSLDTADTRMGNLVQTALALAPALVPISATATPALVGLTSQLGFAAAGAGVLVTAMNGVGDAIGAVNDYQLDPTNANLEKMQEAMAALPAEGRQFVRFLDKEVLPALDKLQDVAAEGALDGVQDGIDDLLKRLPAVRTIVDELATGAGTLAADLGEGLASDEFDGFFRFLKTEAEPTLVTFGRTVGNVLDGLMTTLIGLNPLANDFEEALLDWSRGFADLDPSDFEGFVEYVRDVGPAALDALGALGGALVAIVKAAAPVGEVALPVIEALANTLEVVAESPAGPVLIATAAGLSAVSRAVALYNAANGSAIAGFLGKSGKDGAAAGLGLRAAAAGAAALALAFTDLDDKAGLSNTTMLAAMGLMVGPWGAAAGATVGAILDIKSANDDLNASFDETADVVRSGTFDERREELRRLREEIEEFESFEFVGDSGRGFFGDLKGEIALIGDAFTGADDKRRQFVDELRATRGMGDLGTLWADGLGMTAGAFDAASDSANEFRESLKAVNRALDGRANLRDYQAALDDFTDSVKENGRSLDIGTEAGRSNQAALDNIASTALTVAENFKGMNRVRVLDQARDDFLDAAAKLRIPKEEAERLATRLGLLDKQKVKPKIDADTVLAKKKIGEAEDWINGWGKKNARATVDADARPAWDILSQVGRDLEDVDSTTAEPKIDINDGNSRGIMLAVREEMARLDGLTSNLYIVTTQRTVQPGKPGPQDASGSASGSTVPKDGGPYTDRFPYLLAPGEEVISNRNGQADRNRPLLKAINAGRMADGGTAGKDETEAQQKAREAREEARRRAQERRRRAEEKRQRQLDKQETKALLGSDLDDEGQQANLGVRDARRRLRSAREAGRPKSEMLDLRLLLKQARGDRDDVRADARADREDARVEREEKALTEYLERQEKAAETALLAAEDQLDAAEKNADSAQATLDATKQLKDSLKESVAGQFKGSLTGGGLSGLMSTLKKDTDGGSAMTATLQALKDAGLDTTGPAAGLFKELAESNDLTTANQLLSGGQSAIDAAEQAYVARDQSNNARGEFVAEASYGQMIAAQTETLAVAQQQVAVAEAAKAAMEAQLNQVHADLQNVSATVAAQATQFAAALNTVSANAVRGTGWGSIGSRPR